VVAGGGYLVFSDIGNNRRMQWSPGAGVMLGQEPTNEANGLTRDRQGRLVAGEHLARCVPRQDPDGSITVGANRYHGHRLNRPNDVVVKSDGSLSFTDPGLGRIASALDVCGVYRVSPDLGEIHVLVWDCVVPNGLAFSPDARMLYIHNSRRGYIRAFAVEPTGSLAPATDRVFATLQDDRIGVPNGMKVDVEGNVYGTGPGGIWIFDPHGTHLGTIATGAQTTNVAWGNADWSALYVTTWSTVGRIRMTIPGIPVPRGHI
jgi:gluconolactonase